MDCENCRHLTVVGLHDTGPWLHSFKTNVSVSGVFDFRNYQTISETTKRYQKLPNLLIIFVSVAAAAAGLLTGVPIPVCRSILSKMAGTEKQGQQHYVNHLIENVDQTPVAVWMM